MARDHARVLCSIWNDAEFRQLTVAGQRLYVLLLSQPTVSYAGVLSVTLRRWASCSGETTTADVEKSLQELAEHRFIVLDDDTEEVLLRSFIRNDGVAAQPNVLTRALRDALAVTSPTIRRALAVELRRLPPRRETGTDKRGRPVVYPDPHACAEQLDPTPSMGSGQPVEPIAEPFPEPFPEPIDEKGSGNPSWNPRGTGSGSGTGCSVGINSSSVARSELADTGTDTATSTATDDEPAAAAADAAPVPSTPAPTAAPAASRPKPDPLRGFDDFWTSYPRKVGKDDARRAWQQKVTRPGLDPARVAAAAAAHAARWVADERPREFIPHPATWLRRGSYDDELTPAAATAARPVRGQLAAHHDPAVTGKRRLG